MSWKADRLRQLFVKLLFFLQQGTSPMLELPYLGGGGGGGGGGIFLKFVPTVVTSYPGFHLRKVLDGR